MCPARARSSSGTARSTRPSASWASDWGALRLYAGGGVIGAVPGGEMTLALGLALVLALARRAVGGGAAGLFAPVIRLAPEP